MTKHVQLSNPSNVLGVNVENWSWEQAFGHVVDQLNAPQGHHLYAFLNANNANRASVDKKYRECLSNATVLPDGVGVDVASRLSHGHTFTANLNGTDFIPGLLVFIEKPITIALVGSTNEVVQRAADLFKSATPWHDFIAVSDGYFGDSGTDDVLQKLEAISADIVLVGMGTPFQELWVDKHMKPEHGHLVFTVGALFDFVSESVPRAPRAWQDMRIEWVHRLLIEPARLWRRYLIGNPVFLWRILRSILMDRLKSR